MANKRIRTIVWGTVAAVFLIAGRMSPAQEAPGASAAQSDDETVLEEIVVTARMRSESAQDVPLSETVFSSAQIEDARINQVNDFITLTPNVTLAQSQSAGISFMTIRGITQVRNGEPPVATVVDGVLQINSRQFTQELFDIERIEVLRGPQGAIYGRNATGGAIIITTKQPTNEFAGHLRTGYGKGEEKLFEGTISGPLVEDKLMFRLAARYTDRNGYFTNINLNRKVDPFEDITVRGLLKWMISDRLTADFRVSIGRTDGGSLNFQHQPAIIGPDGVTLDPDNPFPFDFSINDANLVDRNFKATNIGQNNRDIDELSLKLDYETDFAIFTSITSYNKVKEFSDGDQFPYTASLTRFLFGGAFVVDGTQTQFVDIEAWSQEFRVASPSDQRLRWMVGFYYLSTDRFISSTTGDDRGQGILDVKRMPFFDSSVNPTLSFFADDNNNKAWAAFGNAALDITDRLEASFAVRYDKDKRNQFVSPLNTGGVPGSVNRRTFDKAQPKVALRYEAGDNANLYASWGVGFRSGQFNQNGVGAAAAAAGIVGVEDVVGQEETRTVEAGFKSEWFNRRLRLNGAFYRTNVDGQQYFVFIGGVGAQVLVNIDKVRLIGGELEAVVRLADGLDAYASFGITDSRINQYALNPADVGNWAPYVPKSTVNLGAQYRTTIVDGFGLFARIDYERRGKQFWDPENSTARNALDLVNVRFGLEDPDGAWSLIATIQNLTDEVYNSEFVLGGFAHPALPRRYHIDLRYNF